MGKTRIEPRRLDRGPGRQSCGKGESDVRKTKVGLSTKSNALLFRRLRPSGKLLISCRRQMCLVVVLAFGLLAGFSAAGAVDTTTAVTTSPASPVVVGQAVTVTWTLTAQTSSTVAFCDPLSRRIKSPGSGTWNILDDTDTAIGGSPFTSTHPFTPLIAGTYTIEGAYAGCPTLDPVLNASTGSALLTVNKADTTTSVVSDLASPVTGQTITFTATVAASSPGTGTPTGSVTFYADGTPIPGGQNVALAAGQAQCTASYNVSDSTVDITAAYGGDANYNGSDNTAAPHSQTIVPANTTTAVTSAPSSSVTGQDVTFTATVTTDAPGSGTPTGTVTVTIEDKDDNPIATHGPVALDGLGQASVTTNAFKASLSAPAGVAPDGYRVTATYDGSSDPNYNDSPVSTIHYQIVDKADTSITIDSDNPDPSLEDQAYDVTWTVIVVVPGSEVAGIGATPSGNVTVDDGAVTAPATPVGTGTVSITSTSAGAKTLTATYAGDGDYNGSDTTASHTVNSKGTTISVSSATNPSAMEQNVVFTATLTPDSAGGADPTGTVTFKDGGAAIGTDNDGTDGWSLTYAFTSAGSKSITAEYSGDGIYTGSTSSAITQTVNKLDVVLTITGDAPDPSEINEAYDVTWTHTDSSPTLTPSGNVTVTDGTDPTTPTDITTLSAWLTSSTAGVKTLTASYAGDANFNPTTATATHQVDKDDVTFTITPSNTPTWDSGDPGTFAVTLAAHGPATATPTGTVSFHIKDKNNITIATSGPHVLAAGQATSGSVTLTAAQSQVSVHVDYSGDTLFNADTETHLQDVAAAANFAIVSDDPDPSAVGETVTVAWTYSAPGIPNAGTIQVIEDGSTFGSTKPVTATATSGTIDYAGTLAGTKTLTLRYHDSVDVTDEDTPVGETHIVVAYDTVTTVALVPGSVYVNQPTTINGRVYVNPDPTPDSTPGLPGKALGFTSNASPGSDGNLSASYCVLVGGADDASCSIATYTPTMASSDSETHRIKGSFTGDSTYGASESAFIDLTVNKRPPSVTVVCFPDWVYIDQDTICTVTVDDGTVAPGSTIPTGTVTFDNGAGKAGAFTTSDSGSLVHGIYDATYTPAAGDAGSSTATTTIGANYGGSPVYTTGATSADLEVRVRPTETTLTWQDSQGGNDAIFLYETGRVIVTVTDIGPADSASPPQGTLGVVSGPITLVSALSPISGSTDASQAFYSFRKLAMTETQAFIGVTVEYYPASPQTHDESDGSTDVSVQKRTTETVVVCEDIVDGNCTVTVTDTASRGTSPSPAGAAVNQADSLNFCSLPAGGGTSSTCSNTVIGDSMMQPFAVAYEPGDDIHVGSYAMDMIERPLVPEGSCGVLHIEDSIFGLNTTCTVMAALQVLLESGAAAASILVDPVWTAVFPGSTIPVGDMIAGGLTGLSLHGEIAIQVMCTDVDGDGIPGSVEAVIAGLWDHEWDSDHDGMGDLDEIDEANGDMATSYDASKHNSCACPNPTVSDSDGDDIQDGNEQGYFGTNFCNDDTDEDGLNDGQEVGTFSQYNSDSGATITPRTDARDHADPLAADTDGDGLGDAQEFTAGRLATSTSDPDYSSFINDADSDDDGLQDGAEDTNSDGRWSGTIGGTTSHGSGETHLCMADTDGDGLSDGEEVALFGAGDVHVVTPTGSTTVPALDVDSDNDGLSDYEEVNTTKTDPLDFDTDDDGLWDVNELRATGGTWPQRSFSQVSDPLDPDTDDDDIPDNVEYDGTGLGTGHGLGGSDDTVCPYVNDDDSDNDGLQDGVEDANHDGTWGISGGGITIGSFGTQASKSVAYWETDPCNPDTDGDGIRDGEEVNLIGGGPIPGRPIPAPGFNTVTPEGRSTVTPVGPVYTGGPLFTFEPQNGLPIGVTVPALDVDSDNDGLSDYEEVNITGTDPLDADSDNDTLMDADEFVALGGTIGSTPRRTFDQESNPLDINTDDDHLFDPVEGACGNVVNPGTGLSALAGQLGGTRDTTCPLINDDDSDNDGVQDGAVVPISRAGPGMTYSYTFFEGFEDVPDALDAPPGSIRTIVTAATGEQELSDDVCNACDPDSDGDGLTDGEEIGIGTDPSDWDTDDDGRNDWHEMTGGGPIPTDPFDPDTDDDGLLDSAEVFGANPTNPVNADTDGDGLCDGGAGTPYMTSGHPTVTVNPICKSCSEPGNTSCGTSVRTGSPDGIGDHPNPMGLGEDENGNGNWDGGETDPNQYDTDGDAEGDGIEKLGFSTSRQSTIPLTDMLGNTISVLYPDCGCLDPLDPDTDADGISDGVEDLNHDGNFDFNSSDFDFQDLLDGAPQPDPEETNPCDPDTDDDGLTDYAERHQPNPAVFYPYNPTNPLDHDTDNDYLFDGEEVTWICIDPGFDFDPNRDGILDYFVMTVLGDVLDPTNRDSDSDGYIDGLDPNPCYSWLLPIGQTLDEATLDSDGDGYADSDEVAAGTDPDDVDDFPIPFVEDYDRDLELDDSLWLEDYNGDGIVDSVAIDLDTDHLVDARVGIIQLRDLTIGDFDGDGSEDDVEMVIVYAFSNGRIIQPRVMLTIVDLDTDFIVDEVRFAE